MEIGKRVTDSLGLPKDKFYKMQKCCPEQLAFIETLGDTMLEAYPEYLTYKAEVEDKARTIYVFLENRRKVASFSRFLIARGVYSALSTYPHTEKTLFSYNGLKHFASLQKVEQSNLLFEEWLDANPIKLTL